MQLFLIKIVAMLFIGLITQSVWACDITFSMVGGHQQCFKTGDTIVVEVKVKFKQEKCAESPRLTRIYRNGLKIIDESKWEIDGVYASKMLVLRVMENKKKKVILTVQRTSKMDDCFNQRRFKFCLDE